MSDIGIRSDVQSVLAQMKALRAQAQAGLEQPPRTDETRPGEVPGSFATMLKTATDGVNALQQQSSDLSTRFVRGESRDLVGAIVAGQKANVAFQGLVHTRNQLINAYQEIMKMGM